MKEIEYNGKRYKSDGQSMWIDGVLQDFKLPEQIRQISQETILRINDYLWDGKDFYYKHPRLENPNLLNKDLIK